MNFKTLSIKIASAGLALITVTAAANEKLNAVAEGDPALARMSSNLLQARTKSKTGAKGTDAIKSLAPHAVRGGKIQCIIGAKTVSTDLLNAIAAQGIDMVHQVSSFGDHHMIVVQCSDVLQLDAVSRHADVLGITEEPEAQCNSVGVGDNQVDRAIRAANLRSAFGLNGSGQRVGVLSDSFNDTRGGAIVGGILTGCLDQNSGDLPASIRIIDAGPGGGSDEGNGMAQLIFDIAPACNIAFASAFTSYASFATNITALRTDPSAPSNIIVDDVIYFAEPMFQDGPIAIAADNCGLANVPYFSSAGNFGSDAHERAFQDFSVTDDTNFPPSGNDLHDFGVATGLASDRFLTINVGGGGGGRVRAILHWDEPYGGVLGAGPGASSDVDVLLVNSTVTPVVFGNIVASSTAVQGSVATPSGEPIETFNATGLAAGTYHLIVDHFSGRRPVNLHLLVDTGNNTTIVDSAYLGGRTIYGHSTAANAIAVAAINYFEYEPTARAAGSAGFTPGTFEGLGTVIDVEAFSSRGGNLPFFFSQDGLTRFGTPLIRFKPEFTAPDACDTTFFGSGDFDGSGRPNFFGTSAAAPNAAAVAALMRQRFIATAQPTTSQHIYQRLIDTAVDLKAGLNVELAGPDVDAGAGVIDARDAAARPPTIGVTPPAGLAFGSIFVGQTADLPVTISNSGEESLQVSNMTFTNAAFSLAPGQTSSFNVGAGLSVNRIIRFTPVVGNITGTLNIASNDPVTPVLAVSLSGTGVNPLPNIVVLPPALDFGLRTIGTVTPLALTIQNTGDAPLQVSGLEALPGTAFTHSALLPLVIPVAGSANVDISFAPTVQGLAVANMVIVSNDPDQPLLGYALTGNGQCAIDGLPTAQSGIDLSPSILRARKSRRSVSLTVDIRQLVGPADPTQRALGVPNTQLSAVIVPTDYQICDLGQAPVVTVNVRGGKQGRPGRPAPSRRARLNVPAAQVPAGSRILIICDPSNAQAEPDERNNFTLSQPF